MAQMSQYKNRFLCIQTNQRQSSYKMGCSVLTIDSRAYIFFFLILIFAGVGSWVLPNIFCEEQTSNMNSESFKVRRNIICSALVSEGHQAFSNRTKRNKSGKGMFWKRAEGGGGLGQRNHILLPNIFPNFIFPLTHKGHTGRSMAFLRPLMFRTENGNLLQNMNRI